MNKALNNYNRFGSMKDHPEYGFLTDDQWNAVLALLDRDLLDEPHAGVGCTIGDNEIELGFDLYMRDGNTMWAEALSDGATRAKLSDILLNSGVEVPDAIRCLVRTIIVLIDKCDKSDLPALDLVGVLNAIA